MNPKVKLISIFIALLQSCGPLSNYAVYTEKNHKANYAFEALAPPESDFIDQPGASVFIDSKELEINHEYIFSRATSNYLEKDEVYFFFTNTLIQNIGYAPGGNQAEKGSRQLKNNNEYEIALNSLTISFMPQQPGEYNEQAPFYFEAKAYVAASNHNGSINKEFTVSGNYMLVIDLVDAKLVRDLCFEGINQLANNIFEYFFATGKP
ncbi:MAG: hypothetical protein HC896_16685 [Bacteroidales bacterium]|nr:hypothetical protein [Bacteroidales bacterium]